MKICLVMAGHGDGGLEGHFVELGNGLAKNNSVHVIVHPKMLGRFDKAVTAHSLDLQKSRNNPVVLFSLVSQIKKINPDIIHAHANKAVAMVTRIRSFLPEPIKLIGTLHNKKKKLTDFNKLDFVIGVSNRIIRPLANPNKKAIYNGVEIDSGRIKGKNYFSGILPEDVVNNHKIVVNLGRLVPAKRIDLSIKSFQGIGGASLVIVGDGPQRSRLEDLVKELGLENIYFIGFRTDAVELLSAADLCLISSDREGFNYVMLEALMVRTPVVSTDVADMKLILPKRFVVDTGAESELREIISNSLAELDAVLAEYEPVFNWVQEHLTTNIMIESVNDVYNTVAN